MTTDTATTTVTLSVNGQTHEVKVEPRHTLADVLRHQLGLTGTHLGCEHGICGACTVLVDGEPTRSCLLFAIQADDVEVETVESLDDHGKLDELQAAFARHHGLQCGFCTPGFLMLLTGWLRDNDAPDEAEMQDVVASNLCRCTGYQGIVEAARDAAGLPPVPSRNRLDPVDDSHLPDDEHGRGDDESGTSPREQDQP